MWQPDLRPREKVAKSNAKPLVAATSSSPDIPVLVLATVLASLTVTTPTFAASDTACAAALDSAQRIVALPAHILPTLALVESGRLINGHVVPWPWTVNVAGAGHFYETKTDAIQAVQSYQAQGYSSIDVGCMQINLLMHPGAFTSLDQAFDPIANTTYGAQFLQTLYSASHSWSVAITAYHSATPSLAADYANKIIAVWPGAVAYGLLPGSASVSLHPNWTEAFARSIAADIEARRKRNVCIGLIPIRSQLRLAPVGQRHGSAWPQGIP